MRQTRVLSSHVVIFTLTKLVGKPIYFTDFNSIDWINCFVFLFYFCVNLLAQNSN